MTTGMGNPPAETPVVPPAAPPAPPPAVTAPPGEPDWLPERLERAEKSALKKHFGISDPAEIKKRLDAAAAYEKAEEERKKAQLSETDRLKSEIEESKRATAEAQARADEAAFRGQLYRVCSEKGIRNHDYAIFAVTNQLAKLPDGEQLDESAFLDELAKDPMQRASLGIVDASGTPPVPPTVRTSPATTTPGGTAKPPTPPNNEPPKTPSAFDQNDAEWAKTRATLGLR